MTLHWSPPPAAGAAGDPVVLPISPSRLRPWKAPKKESSFAGADFLAVVVCCKWEKSVRFWYWWVKILIFYFDFHWSPTRGRQWWLLKWVFLTVLSVLFLASMACCRFLWKIAQGNVKHGTWASSLFMWGTALSSLSQVCLAKSQLDNKTVTELLTLLSDC